MVLRGGPKPRADLDEVSGWTTGELARVLLAACFVECLLRMAHTEMHDWPSPAGLRDPTVMVQSRTLDANGDGHGSRADAEPRAGFNDNYGGQKGNFLP